VYLLHFFLFCLLVKLFALPALSGLVNKDLHKHASPFQPGITRR